jgi:hypothetical protein
VPERGRPEMTVMKGASSAPVSLRNSPFIGPMYHRRGHWW